MVAFMVMNTDVIQFLSPIDETLFVETIEE